MEKNCSKCGHIKPVEEFYKCTTKSGNTIYSSRCCLCINEWDKNRKIKKYEKKYPDFDNEIWKDVIGFEGLYEVSNKQRVRNRLKRVITNKLNQAGYYRMILYKENHRTNKLLHRLIAESFIENPNNYTVVNHKDGNKLNNDIENLEWCTIQQNSEHAYKLGLVTNTFESGLNHPGRKITEVKYNYIKQLLLNKIRIVDIAKELKLSIKLISDIKHNRYKYKYWESIKS